MRTVSPTSRLRGRVRVPGDKSASHRAILISALADGESALEGLSRGDDVACTADIVEHLGATVTWSGERLYVTGPPGGLSPSDAPLWCGNSGTTMRLVSGLLAAVPGTHHLAGDPSLSSRPMDRVAEPLERMGASVSGTGERVFAPLTIEGRRPLRAIHYEVPVPSAQVKSALIFAGLGGDGTTVITEATRTRPTTEKMLLEAGVDVVVDESGTGRVVRVRPSRPQPHTWRVPADPSQAAFFVVLGALHNDAEIVVEAIDDAPERVGFLTVLSRMGARLELTPANGGLEVLVRSGELVATDIHSSEIPSVDEVPILAVAAAAATGRSHFRAMAELRLKESDRFAGSLRLAHLLGCEVGSTGDDFWIEGVGSAQRFSHLSIDAGLDHRMVMSSAVAGVSGRGADIEGESTVSSSYPHFFDDLEEMSR